MPQFRIQRHSVTNGEYKKFVADGAPAPHFWVEKGSSTYYRGMFREYPLPLDWPVYVTQQEAQAYADWLGKALPSEAQFHRAAYGTASGENRDYPWGSAEPAHAYGNFDGKRWDPEPVSASLAGSSAFGVAQMVGNGWQWTNSVFAPFPGFAARPSYPGYSANFFDGEHYVMKGASPRTPKRLLRRSFRNWFRPDYPYTYATLPLRGKLERLMSASTQPQLSQFAFDVAEGLSLEGQKKLAPRYFYDDLGSSLFEAITLLPEYGLTRADERLLKVHAGEIARAVHNVSTVSELGSGSGKKTAHVIRGLQANGRTVRYRPIDVSSLALSSCQRELGNLCEVRPVCGDWLSGLDGIARERTGSGSMLLLFLGSSIGNLDRRDMPDFFRELRVRLRPNDYLLVGADLVKDQDTMIAAYDDPTGVTAAFNLNVLGRINRELKADFDLRSFGHEVRWNETERRIEMHLVSFRNQEVEIGALDVRVPFTAGETIWTESSHKFTEEEFENFATSSGFTPVASWNDLEWPFLEALWTV